mgnify:CR=1 FL=1
MASSNYAEDLRIDHSILDQHADSYRKIRNTFRYLLGNLNDNFEKIDLDKIDTKKIRNGQLVDYNAPHDLKGIVRIYADNGLFVGIGSIDSSNTVSAKRLLSDPSM